MKPKADPEDFGVCNSVPEGLPSAHPCPYLRGNAGHVPRDITWPDHLVVFPASWDSLGLQTILRCGKLKQLTGHHSFGDERQIPLDSGTGAIIL